MLHCGIPTIYHKAKISLNRDNNYSLTVALRLFREKINVTGMEYTISKQSVLRQTDRQTEGERERKSETGRQTEVHRHRERHLAKSCCPSSSKMQLCIYKADKEPRTMKIDNIDMRKVIRQSMSTEWQQRLENDRK